MRRLFIAPLTVAAAALAGVPALAHHSMSMADMSREILIEGTVARFDWVNPHIYLIVETEGPDGQSVLIEGDTLVIDTIAFEPNPSGLAANVPSIPGKHTVERLTLTDDRLRLRYEITVEDPMYLSAPARLTQQWDYRPDLQFSPPSQACDPEVAERYIDESAE